MFAITLDSDKYLKIWSNRYRTPESIIVDAIPEETDEEKLRCYRYIKKKFVLDEEKWAAIKTERAETQRIDEITGQIDDLKHVLTSSDYQIIKCYEYALNSLEMPYNVEALHAERQALRDKINELESSLQQGENTEE